MNRITLIVFLGFYLAACSSVPSSRPETMLPVAESATGAAVDMGNHALVRRQLLAQLSEWKGVPYQFGGLTKQGVDCSGFIYLTFAEEFGIRIPRTTKSQVLKGQVIDQADLVPGDLVFFMTGYNQRHIGIYVGKKQFIHTSSSRGVMLSRLDNPYWQSAYWHARRIAL
ncbi:MAG: lipoprotein Spr/probable lipoprotein NlpC [Oleispira sp.]|jgi:lipoprotein Spr/probable lipoprotein NlpC